MGINTSNLRRPYLADSASSSSFSDREPYYYEINIEGVYIIDTDENFIFRKWLSITPNEPAIARCLEKATERDLLHEDTPELREELAFVMTDEQYIRFRLVAEWISIWHTHDDIRRINMQVDEAEAWWEHEMGDHSPVRHRQKKKKRRGFRAWLKSKPWTRSR